MESNWTADVTSHLMDRSACPRCGIRALELGWCRNCGADLSSPVAEQIWESSIAAVRAIEHRQQLIGTLTDVKATSAATQPPPPVATASAPPPSRVPVAAPVPAGASSQLSVQSVLAVAGAGLFAVAAIVFTFFNPEIDYATRTTIIAIVTALFLGGAWLFASRGLQFSAEAVGALGMVFLALDVWAFADSAPDGVNGWAFAGIGTVVASSLMIAVAALVRLRVWLWLSIIGLSLAAAFFGYATENWWGATVGHLAAAFVALGAHELARRLGARFDSALVADRVTATIVQFVAAFMVIVAIVFGLLPEPDGGVMPWTFGVAGLLAGLALLAALSTRNEAVAAWSVLAGAFAVAAVGILPHAFEVQPWEWEFALIPLAAAVAFFAISVIRRTGSIHRVPLLVGALSIALTAAVPAAGIAVGRVGAGLLSNISWLFGVQFWTSDPEMWIAATAGVAATASAVWGASRFASGSLATGFAVLSRWLGGLALLSAALWPGLTLEWRVTTELAVSLLLSAALIFVPRFRASRTLLRVPMIVTAITALLAGIAMSWNDQVVAVIAGAAALAVLVALAYTMPRVLHPLFMGLGFAYALIVFANALDLTTLETLPILCLTATFGSTVALAATLTPWLRPGTWYAVLIVTAIPFLIAVGVLFVEIKGWVALSTGVTFLLALALVITRRPGLTIFLRAAAAALLVPSLAVVIIALGAQLFEVSASPITLPIIAVLVAAVLPTTGIVEAELTKNSLSESNARAVRLWIEISTLLTAGIAVILAFARDAAGPETAFLVFVIVGIGAAATAIWANRRYGWIVAGIAWTGALWTALGILGVSVTTVEPYALPPALAAAVVGAILVARGHQAAVGLYASGLGAGLASSLFVLALSGSGEDAALPWRAFGLLGGSLLLLAIGFLIRGGSEDKPNRFLPLRRPTLVLAIAAAASGAIQGMRYGWGFDELPDFLDPSYVILTVLAFALVATALAVGAGRVAMTGPGWREVPLRWWFVPASVYLVVGPMTAIGPTVLETWILWSLMIVLLALLVITALRARTRAVTLPPIWFVFGLAWVTGVVGWSQRTEIRLEGWSVPMGVALLAAGIIAMPKLEEQFGRVDLNSWPIGFRGSWRLLSPGILVLVVPSMIATFTDPATERAIFVIVAALASVLAGAFLRLRAPFILGLIVLPLEIIFVFAVQIGRGVESVPWWITLAAAGAVLLAIAVRAERRTGKDASTGARMGDLE